MNGKNAARSKQFWLRSAGAVVTFVLVCAGFSYLYFNAFEYHYAAYLAVDAQGNVYVADSGPHQIDKFSNQGEKLATFGKDEFHYGPNLVTLDHQGNIYATDSSDQIKKFDAKGNFLLGWDIPYSYSKPLVADSHNNLYLVLGGTRQVQKYGPTGQLINSWALKAAATDHLSNVTDLVIDAQDNVYLYDAQNSKLNKYDAQGQLLSHLDNFSSSYNYNITIDRQGNFYRLAGAHQIEKLNNQGKVIATWGKPANPNRSYDPKEYRAIAVDQQGNLFAFYQEKGPYSIDKYNSNGQLVKKWSVGWPQWLQLVFQFGVAPLLGVLIGLIFRIGVPVKRPDIDPIQETLPLWVAQATTYPQTLQDHLNLKTLEKSTNNGNQLPA